MKLLSIFNFHKKRSAVELAAEKHAQTIKEAPATFLAILNKDIEFLDRLINSVCPGTEHVAEAGLGSDAEADLEDTIVPTSDDALDTGLKVPPPPSVLFYNETRLGNLLIAASNYQSWLKLQMKNKNQSKKRVELMMYLSNRSNGDLMCFPKYLTELVQSIKSAENLNMILFYHSLLVNCLIEIKQEIQ